MSRRMMDIFTRMFNGQRARGFVYWKCCQCHTACTIPDGVYCSKCNHERCMNCK